MTVTKENDATRENSKKLEGLSYYHPFSIETVFKSEVARFPSFYLATSFFPIGNICGIFVGEKRVFSAFG